MAAQKGLLLQSQLEQKPHFLGHLDGNAGPTLNCSTARRDPSPEAQCNCNSQSALAMNIHCMLCNNAGATRAKKALPMTQFPDDINTKHKHCQLDALILPPCHPKLNRVHYSHLTISSCLILNQVVCGVWDCLS